MCIEALLILSLNFKALSVPPLPPHEAGVETSELLPLHELGLPLLAGSVSQAGISWPSGAYLLLPALLWSLWGIVEETNYMALCTYLGGSNLSTELLPCPLTLVQVHLASAYSWVLSRCHWGSCLRIVENENVQPSLESSTQSLENSCIPVKETPEI